MRFPNARILIFAKAPLPGGCKTRLIPALGRDGAAALAERLLCGTIERIGGAGLAPAELWCAPDVEHPLFQRLAIGFDLRLEIQRGDDLGVRMQHATALALERAERVVLIGTDCPDLGPEYLRQALDSLSEHAVALGPADDGGYVLLGLSRDARRVLPRLFEEVPWGSDRVAEITRQRLEASLLRWTELPSLMDIDRPEDLVHLGVSGDRSPV